LGGGARGKGHEARSAKGVGNVGGKGDREKVVLKKHQKKEKPRGNEAIIQPTEKGKSKKGKKPLGRYMKGEKELESGRGVYRADGSVWVLGVGKGLLRKRERRGEGVDPRGEEESVEWGTGARIGKKRIHQKTKLDWEVKWKHGGKALVGGKGGSEKRGTGQGLGGGKGDKQ